MEGTQAFGRSLLNTTSATAVLALIGAVPATRTIVAGNGLTGAGNLAADREIALGTPSSITLTGTNSVTAESHTHELSRETWREMQASHMGINVIGSIMFAVYLGSAEVTYGGTTNGSNLVPTGTQGRQPVSNISGTWRCLGYARPDVDTLTLWIRIS